MTENSDKKIKVAMIKKMMFIVKQVLLTDKEGGEENLKEKKIFKAIFICLDIYSYGIEEKD